MPRMRALFAAAVLVVGLLAPGCKDKTKVELFVDGFQPKNVRFEIEDKGPLTKAQIAELKTHRDIDGVLEIPEGSCAGPCRVSIVSVYVHNMDNDAVDQPPPVVRIKSPPGRAKRQPIAFGGEQISKGRIGRIRWVVEMWPEEKSLTAVLSGSVLIVDAPSTPPTTTPPPPPTAGGQAAPPGAP